MNNRTGMSVAAFLIVAMALFGVVYVSGSGLVSGGVSTTLAQAQATTISQLSFSSYNSKPSLSFDGSNNTPTTIPNTTTSTTSTINTTSSLSTINSTVNATNSTTSIAQSQVISSQNIPTPSISITPTSLVLDSNQSYTFTASQPTGGIPPYTYSWGNAGGFTVVSGCTSNDQSCTVQAENQTSTYYSQVYVYSIDSTSSNQTNVATSQVTINPPITNVYTNFGGFANSNDSAYILESAATGGTPPYNFTWQLSNFTQVSGCGSLDSTCTVSPNANGSTSAMLTVTDSATIPMTVVDWHVSSVTLSPHINLASSEGYSVFGVNVTLDSGSTPQSDIQTPTITYAWSSNNGLSVASCPTTGGLSITCNIINPVVTTFTSNKITVLVTHANAIVIGQSSNPDSGACTYLSGSSPHQKYNCVYATGASDFAILNNYPLLKTTLFANKTTIVSHGSVLFTNVTTGGSGGNKYKLILNNTAGTVQNGNTITFTSGSLNVQKYLVTLIVNDSIGEIASSNVLITINESLQLNQTRVLYPGNERIGIPTFSRDQVVVDTDTGAFGGLPPYTYEWFVAFPGSITFNPASCGPQATGPMTNHVYPCDFATNSSSPLGQYHFQLQATDNATPPGSVTASIEPFNLNTSLILTLFKANWTYISADQSVFFTNTTTGGTGGDVWTYNLISGPTGGMTSLGNNKFEFTQAGNYLVNLYVSDISGENASSNVLIQVTPPLTANLVANWTYISADQSVLFTSSTGGGTGNVIASLTLNNTSGVTQNGDVFTFNQPGTYKVTLNVTDLTGEKNQSSVVIIVTPPLTTTINANWTYISADQKVIFWNVSTGGTGSDVNTYTINSTNGVSVLGNVVTFTAAGNYLVTLITTDKTDEIATNSINIQVTPPLTTNLIANWTYISQGQKVKLTNVTTGGTGSNAYTYSIIYCTGFETVQTVIQNPISNNIATLNQIGVCHIKLSVVDLTGEESNSTVNVTVTPPLEARLAANWTYISVDQKIRFNVSTTGGTGNNVYTYFVNGNPVITTSNSSIVLPANLAGNYLVSAGVVDQTGEVANTLAISITVTPALNISLTANATYISADQLVLLTNNTTGGTGSNSYSYDVTSNPPDAVYSLEGNIFSPSTPGNYTITENVTDLTGEKSSNSVTIQVTPPLVITANASMNYISVDQTVTITNHTTGGTGGNVYDYSVTCNDQNAGYIINDNGSITFTQQDSDCQVLVSVTDKSGEYNYTYVNITVTPPLVITDFTANQTYISAGQTISLTNYTSGGTGNNTYKTTVNNTEGVVFNDNGTVTFNTAGTYNITLNVTDQSGETNQSSLIIIVTPPLTTQLIPNRTYISADQGVSFTNVTLNGTGSYKYSISVNPSEGAVFGNGVINFTTPGNYVVTLNVTDYSGEFANSSVNITVTPPLVITSFNASQTYISADQTVNFTYNTTGGTGNNQFTYTVRCDSSYESPYSISGNSITFTHPGYCIVILNVTDQTGETNSSKIAIQITPPLIITDLIPNMSLISTGQTVSFTNITYYGTGNNTYSYSVNNGIAGLDYVINNNSITFNTPGNYLVTETVNDQSGETNSTNTTITVTPPLVITEFNASQTYISADQTVNFTYNTTGGTGNNQFTISVNNTDGATINQNGTITFSTPGLYNVTLNVTDYSGEFNQSSIIINVTKPLVITEFNASQTYISAGQTIDFTNVTTGGTGNNKYSYSVECESQSNNPYSISNNSITFTAPAYCLVTLNVSDLSGETNSSVLEIGVTPPLTTQLIANRTYISADQGVSFTNVTLNGTGNNNYIISVKPSEGVIFGDSGVINFTTPGNYVVTLNVTDQSGEFANSSVNVTVTPPLTTTLFPNRTLISTGQWISFINDTFNGTGSNSYWYSFSCDGAVQNETNGNTWQFNLPTEVPCSVTLHVSDLSGETANSTVNVTVTPPLTTNLTANWTYISAGQSVKFTNVTLNGTGGNKYSYTYECDGVSIGDNNVFTFNDAGLCTVTLNVSDLSGETNSSSVTINVTPPLTTTLIPNRTLISAGQNVSFSNITTGGTGNVIYTYTFDNTTGVISNGNNIFTFNVPGNFIVSITSNDATGEVSSSNVTITVTDTLGLILLENKHKIVQGSTIVFSNITTGGTGHNVYWYTISNSVGVTFNGNNAVFQDVGTYNITLHVTDISGEYNQSSNTVVVDEPLLINESFTSTPYVSADQLVNVSSSGPWPDSGVGPYTYEWFYVLLPNFVIYPATICADPTSLTCLFQTNSNTPTGQYLFFLQVTDSEVPNMTIDSPFTFITVTPPLVITSFFASPNSIDAGQSVILMNTTSGGTGSNKYTYSVNSLSGVSSQGNTFTFNSPGSYLITLSVKDRTGENATANTVVTVTTPFVTQLFNTTRVLISAGQNVSFSNITTGGSGGNIYTYFVNGNSITVSGNKIVFPNAGNFIVTLGVKDSMGHIANSTGVNVIVTPPLEITLSPNTVLISADQSVTFSNTTSGGTGNNQYSYTTNCPGAVQDEVNGNIWQFNEQTDGSCTVTIHVSDISGEVNQSSATVTVTAPLETTLLANWTYISADQSVSFTNITTGGTGNNVYSYIYECDGVTNSGNNIFTFADQGACRIILHVSDQSGETNSSSNTITVTPPLVITNFVANWTFISAGQSINFTVTSTGGTGNNIYTYFVNGGAVSTTSSNSIVLPATLPGNYLVTVGVEDQTGEVYNAIQVAEITVTPQLGISITPSTATIDQGQTIDYTNITTGGTGGNVYSYTENAPECAAQTDNAFTFNILGVCMVTIHVTDISGEQANATSTVTVVLPPQITLAPSTNVIDAGQIVNFTNVTTGGTPPYVTYAYTVSSQAGVGISDNSIAFANAGNYIVTENVVDSVGGMATSNPVLIHVNPPLVVASPLVSNIIVDQGEWETINSSANGGTEPYSFVFTVTNSLNGNVVYTYSTNGVSAGQIVAFSYNTMNVPNLNDELGNLNINVQVTDTLNTMVTATNVAGIHAHLHSNVTSSNSTPDISQPISLTANIGGGWAPYTYELTVVNASGNVIGTGTIVSNDVSVTFPYTPGANAVGTDEVHVFVTDSASTPTNETLNTSITVSSSVYNPTSNNNSGNNSGNGGNNGGNTGNTGGLTGSGNNAPTVTPPSNTTTTVATTTVAPTTLPTTTVPATSSNSSGTSGTKGSTSQPPSTPSSNSGAYLLFAVLLIAVILGILYLLYGKGNGK
ncbi:MAG: hypothetical protein KGH94_04455 [Candidatus Micrarchaeota archaeon]|nr:hypothetical protein [Candidatus Micrarchaeota archaeon]